MILSLSPAAICQCFSLVSLCTAIADPNWIEVKNSSNPHSRVIYGVASVIHPMQNINNTDLLGGVHGWGLWLLYSLAVLCYGAALFSTASFTVDFFGLHRTRPHLTSSLHVCTGVLCLGAQSVCYGCLYEISLKLQRDRGGPVGDGGPSQVWASLGESFYISLLAFLFSSSASVFSLRSGRRTDSWGSYEVIPEGDRDTESLSVEEEVAINVVIPAEEVQEVW